MGSKIIKKILVLGLVFFIGSATVGISIAFANNNINEYLTAWFAKKSEASKMEIDKAIDIEKDIQKERLKEELKLELQYSENSLKVYTEQEKQARIKELQVYADQLIAGMKTNNQAEKSKVEEKINKIMEKAMKEMDKVDKNNGD